MADATVSVRVDKSIHEEMKTHDDINWSAVLRNAIEERLEETHEIDVERARKAAAMMDRIRKSRIFDKGKSSEEIIREWRDKRRL